VALVSKAGFSGDRGDSSVEIQQFFTGRSDAAPLQPFPRSLFRESAEDAR
jgi:hypothetical protein